MKNMFGVVLALLIVTPGTAQSTSSFEATLADEAAYCAGVYHAVSDHTTSPAFKEYTVMLANALEDIAHDLSPSNVNYLSAKVSDVREGINAFTGLGIGNILTKSQLACHFLSRRIGDIMRGELTIEEHYEKYGLFLQFAL